MIEPALRQALEEVLHRYAFAVDTHDAALLDQVFTADAVIDVTSAGGIVAPYPEFRRWLSPTMARYRVLQHYVSNLRVLEGGESPRTSCYVRAIHGTKAGGGLTFFELGGEYEDRWRLEATGPRITSRVLRIRWRQGSVPG